MNSNPDGGLGLSRHLVTASQTYFINGQVHLQCRKTLHMMFFSITTFFCQCYASMKKTSRENLVECKAIKQLKTSSHDVWNNFSKDHIMLTYFALKSACLQTRQWLPSVYRQMCIIVLLQCLYHWELPHWLLDLSPWWLKGLQNSRYSEGKGILPCVSYMLNMCCRIAFHMVFQVLDPLLWVPVWSSHRVS